MLCMWGVCNDSNFILVNFDIYIQCPLWQNNISLCPFFFFCQTCIRIATPVAGIFFPIPKHIWDWTPSSSSIMSGELFVSLNMMMSHCMEETFATTSPSVSSLIIIVQPCIFSMNMKIMIDCWPSFWLYMHVVCRRLIHLKIETHTWSGQRWWHWIVTLHCDSDEAVPIWHLARLLFPSTIPWLETRELLTSQATTSLRHVYVDHPNLPIPQATHG